MKQQQIEYQSLNGKTATMMLPANGEMVTFRRDVTHGDWKSFSLRPYFIKKGTPCKVLGWMQNFYGVFIRVEHEGWHYDVEVGEIDRQ